MLSVCDRGLPPFERGARGYRHWVLQPSTASRWAMSSGMRALSQNARPSRSHGGIVVWDRGVGSCLGTACGQRHSLILARVDDTSCNSEDHARHMEHTASISGRPLSLRTWSLLHHAPATGAGRCLDARRPLKCCCCCRARPDPKQNNRSRPGTLLARKPSPGHQAGQQLPPSPAS